MNERVVHSRYSHTGQLVFFKLELGSNTLLLDGRPSGRGGVLVRAANGQSESQIMPLRKPDGPHAHNQTTTSSSLSSPPPDFGCYLYCTSYDQTMVAEQTTISYVGRNETQFSIGRALLI